MELFSNDKTVRSNTPEYLKKFNSQSLATQAKNGEQLNCLMPVVKKAFNFLVVDMLELSTDNDAIKNKRGSYDEKWLGESNAKLLKQIDEKRANLIMSRLQKKMKEQ